MMNWNDIRYFVEAAEQGSLSAAAEKMGVSVATIGRRIDSLQNQLGVALMRRGRNGIVLSEAGERLHRAAQNAANRMYDVERIARSLEHGLDNLTIRISSTEPVIAEILAPALNELQTANPAIKVELLTSTQAANLDQQEADLAIRLFKPVGDSLIARRLPEIKLGCYASRDYLAGRDPKKIDLHSERLLALSRAYGDIAEVVWVTDHGLADNVYLLSTSTRALLNAARDGVGVAIAAQRLAENEGLIRIPAPEIPARQCWLVSHRDTRRSHNVIIVKRWIVDTFRHAFL